MASVICPLSTVPVRKDPSDRAEMVSQWLFGETAEVLDRQEKWSRLCFDHDGYEGWVDNRQLADCATPNYDPDLRVLDQTSIVDLGDRQVLLPYGAVLPFYQNGKIRWHDRLVPVNAVTNTVTRSARAEMIDAYMHPFLGAPYLWGGRTPGGVDCSGLVQMIFMLMGIYLPRDTREQAGEGEPIGAVELADTGDLAFFKDGEGRIVHVGIILGQQGEQSRAILHSSGRVRIDKLDQQGIFNAEENRYTHHLDVVKRIA